MLTLTRQIMTNEGQKYKTIILRGQRSVYFSLKPKLKTTFSTTKGV